MQIEKKITQSKIMIHSHFVRKMEDEFKVSDVTIYKALNDITKSPLAKSIRKRAKQLLENEAKSIND